LAELVLTRRAAEDMKSLSASTREAVANVVERLGIEPRFMGRPLLGRLRPLWSARVGNYRILYTLEGADGNERVVVRAIRHRAVAYGGRRRRR
jgi:mRNA-degrading endonuclease RelE of RelBE toxin-antitoxin system